MSGGMTRFLGDSPLRVAVRLLFLSFVVGVVMAALNLHPFEIYDWVEDAVRYVWYEGFAFIERGFGYLALGALIVVPLFLLSRLLKLGRRRPTVDDRL